jgi:hypothetical protein
MKRVWKVVLVVLALFISTILFSYWYIFIKSQPIIDRHQLILCINNNTLKVETAESAKYIFGSKGRSYSDTIEVVVKTTSVFNPFSNKETSFNVPLDSNTKYIKIDKILLKVDTLKRCN